VGFLKDQNAMDMIRHHYKSIQRDMREMLRNLFPAGGNDVGNRVEDAAAISSTDGYEVCARSGVVEAGEAHRATTRIDIRWFTGTRLSLTKSGSGMPDPYNLPEPL